MIQIRWGLLGALIFLALTGAVAARAGEPAVPWSLGESVAGGWVVGKVRRHEEFVRFWMKRGEGITCVEVRYRKGNDPQSWCTRNYRIQPCPGVGENESLLRELLGHLREWETGQERVRFVEKIPESEISEPEISGSDPRPPLVFYPTAFYIALNGLALLIFFLLAAGWLRAFKEDRVVVVSGAVLVAGAVGVALLFGDPAQIPAGWVTVLHEGYGYQNIMHLSGSGVHAEYNFLVLQELWSGVDAYYSGSVVLRATVLVNICLAIVNTIFFFVVACLLSRKAWVALLLSFLLATNLNFIHKTFSETPAQLLFSYFLICTLAAAHLNSGGKTGRAAAYLAMFELVLVGFLLCATRFDMIVLVLPAVLAGLVQLYSLGPRIQKWLGTLWRWTVRHWRWVLPVTAAVAVASTVWWAGYRYPGDPRIGWAIDGLFPFNPSFLTPPRFLVVYLPLGLVLLIVLGMIDAFRRPFSTFFLPLSLLVLWRVYYSATHGFGGPFYERFRFLAYLTPLFVFFAAISFRELGGWLKRIPWVREHTRLAAVLLGLTFLVWWPPGWGGYFDAGHDLPNLPRNRLLLSRNQQTEVRYLLDLMDRYPDCAFLTRTIKHDDYGKPQYLWGLFGKQVRTDLFPQKGGETLDDVAADRAAGNPCVLFYYGLDCNKESGDRCRAQIENRPVVEERLLENLQYTDFHGSDSHPAQIRLGVFRVK